MSRLIQIPVDANLNSKMAKLNEELRRTGEEIVSTNTVNQPDGSSMLVVSVRAATNESKKGRPQNLLLDQVPDVFGGKRVILD